MSLELQSVIRTLMFVQEYQKLSQLPVMVAMQGLIFLSPMIQISIQLNVMDVWLPLMMTSSLVHTIWK